MKEITEVQPSTEDVERFSKEGHMIKRSVMVGRTLIHEVKLKPGHHQAMIFQIRRSSRADDLPT